MELEHSANEPATADHLLTTIPWFAKDEPSEEEFRRWRQLMPGAPEASYTYFMRAEVSGAIKIGRSYHPHRRQGEIRAGAGEPVKVVATMRGDFELCYHQLFERHRVCGEWFSPHPDLLAEIDRLNTCAAASTTSKPSLSASG